MVDHANPQEVGISAREAEVLEALGQHLTNAEIGARLFISIRTVESHVSSLLRKLHANDRRALAAIAGNQSRADGSAGSGAATTTLPSSLTPFVGRSAERATLSAALREHRLVTAVGPGGVGKTRLALSVATEVSDRFADGVWYVDLVPVTDAVMIAPAIADAIGLGERPASSAADDVRSWLAQRQTLLVLDNCEHLLDGVVVLLERLLSGSPQLAVLATSRARLLVPFERAFPVPGLSVEAVNGGPGDAVELFLGRAAAAGTPVLPTDTERVSDICRALDGMALAIELAAARYPSLGVDGLEAGLADHLGLLTGGRRIDDRHHSLRATLDWSYTLLDDPDRALLRRIAVFAEPFTPSAAAAVLSDWPPVSAPQIPSILAGLADQSLLTMSAGSSGTRYRALETIRQYGVDRLQDAGEADEAGGRHLHWCLAESAALVEASGADFVGLRVAFDEVADELRSALAWASRHERHRPEAYRLAIALAHLTFVRGLPGESQRRYEQAAELATEDTDAADALRHAAGAAEARHVGDDAFALWQQAAEAALRAGDRPGAAGDLAHSAELVYRAAGLMATRRAPEQGQALIARGWALADGDPTAQARLLTAEAFARGEDPDTVQLVERAVSLARRVGDPLIESAALDQLTAVQLARGDVRDAAATALGRTRLLASMPMTAKAGLEFFDALVMATECAIGAGDFTAARGLAERLRDLPFYREQGHLATSRLLLVTVLAGDWSEALALSERFCEGWERAGRPRAGNLSIGAYAVASLHGLRGDEDARAAWQDMVADIETPGRAMDKLHVGEFFDALVLVHRGQPDRATKLMSSPPETFMQWYNGLWRPWYAALWAEAAVLSGEPDADDRIDRARVATADNPIATAIVDRAAALATPDSDRGGLSAAAAILRDAGCRYQWARTLVLSGGENRERGESALASMGATPMVWPPE